jgi:hypothetical protein
VPGCGASSREIRGSLADRIMEVKKKLRCVTTRGHNLGVLNSLGPKFGSLTALLLCLGVPSSGGSVVAVFGLAPCCQPAVDLPQAIPLLAVTLVPAPRPVLATAPLTQTGSDAWPAYSGRTATVSRTLASAHGRYLLPRESSGRVRKHSLRAPSKHQSDGCLLDYRDSGNKTEN